MRMQHLDRRTHLCSITQVRLRSAKTSHLGSVYVTMVNGTDHSVTAWWVDFDGNEVRRASMRSNRGLSVARRGARTARYLRTILPVSTK